MKNVWRARRRTRMRDGVKYSVDENKLNQNITNITNEAIKGKGLYFGANSGATVLNKLGSQCRPRRRA